MLNNYGNFKCLSDFDKQREIDSPPSEIGPPTLRPTRVLRLAPPLLMRYCLIQMKKIRLHTLTTLGGSTYTGYTYNHLYQDGLEQCR